MNRQATRFLTAFAMAAAFLLVNPGPAGATATSGFSSTYDFDYILWGQNHFHVTGNGKVTVVLTGTYGPAYSVDIKIERETCGTFGCHWKENYVGGTCTRNRYRGGTAPCNFSPGNNSKAHRIVMSKRNDQVTIKGKVQVS